MLCICKIRFIVLSYTHASKCNIKSGCWIITCDKISFDAQNIKFLIKVQILRLLNIAILNIFQISKRITVQEMLSANWKIKNADSFHMSHLMVHSNLLSINGTNNIESKRILRWLSYKRLVETDLNLSKPQRKQTYF